MEVKAEKILKKKVWIYKYNNVKDMCDHISNMITAGFNIDNVDINELKVEISQTENLNL